MLYIRLFIEREKNIGQSAPECPFKERLQKRNEKSKDNLTQANLFRSVGTWYSTSLV